jgi:antitoxin MazE
VITRIQKWGNSLGLRIPRSFAREARVEQGSTVDLSVKGGRLIIIPIQPGKWRLESLLAGITPGNLHAEQFGDEPVGRESL